MKNDSIKLNNVLKEIDIIVEGESIVTNNNNEKSKLYKEESPLENKDTIKNNKNNFIENDQLNFKCRNIDKILVKRKKSTDNEYKTDKLDSESELLNDDE